MAYQKNTSAELWQTIYNWLTVSGIPINKKYCREEITTHPDYPALTAVTDFLDTGLMDYNAVQADASYVHEFKYPLLAHIKQPGQEWLHIITESADWDKQKDITSHWSGVCIYPEKNSRWANKENDAYRLKDKKSKGQLFIAGGLALALYALAVMNNPSFIFAVIGLLSFVGLITSILVAGQELGVQNSFVKQVCGAVSNGGCAKVLKSSYARGFAGVTAGDLAIIYFATQMIAVFCSAFYPAIFNAILLLSLAGILIAAWSIYTQAVLVKQWCALCLGIVAVLLLQFLTAFSGIYNVGLEALYGRDALLLYAGIGLLISLLQLPIKSLLKVNYANGQKLAELKNWKMDAGLFIAQWQNEQAVDTTIWENDLLIGNPNAPVKIIVACNPYCGPCRTAHETLDKIVEKHNGKICVVVRFLCDPKDETDRRTIVVKSILQIAKSTREQKQIKYAIADWFKEMDYSQWQKKWPPITGYDVQTELENHNLWIIESGIRATPTFFVNGKKIPGRYRIVDFEQLIPQLINELTT